MSPKTKKMSTNLIQKYIEFDKKNILNLHINEFYVQRVKEEACFKMMKEGEAIRCKIGPTFY